MPLMIEAVNPKGVTLRGAPEHLARLMVQINGCNTAEETANAMADQELVHKGRIVRRNGWTVKFVEVAEESV